MPSHFTAIATGTLLSLTLVWSSCDSGEPSVTTPMSSPSSGASSETPLQGARVHELLNPANFEVVFQRTFNGEEKGVFVWRKNEQTLRYDAITSGSDPKHGITSVAKDPESDPAPPFVSCEWIQPRVKQDEFQTACYATFGPLDAIGASLDFALRRTITGSLAKRNVMGIDLECYSFDQVVGAAKGGPGEICVDQARHIPMFVSVSYMTRSHIEDLTAIDIIEEPEFFAGVLDLLIVESIAEGAPTTNTEMQFPSAILSELGLP